MQCGNICNRFSIQVHENNLHLYNDKYLMYHLMNFMLKGVKSIPNDKYLMEVKIACYVSGISFEDDRYNYRKVASSIPVYYSIFDYFWGATN